MFSLRIVRLNLHVLDVTQAYGCLLNLYPITCMGTLWIPNSFLQVWGKFEPEARLMYCMNL